MSAFIVSHGHISAILRAGMASSGHAPRISFASAEHNGQMLVDQNVKSVRIRYPGSGDDLPGRVDREWLEPFVFKLMGRTPPSPVEALKLLACYTDQACEDPDWETSDAFALCETLQTWLIAALPGYEAAAWTWEGS